MTRSMFMAFRMFAILVAAVSACAYIVLASTHETNAISYVMCTIAFTCTYIFMVILLCMFTRVRKFDLGVFTCALVGPSLVVQLVLWRVGVAPFPHLAEAISAFFGISASLLPMSISKMRGESRNERHVASYVEARRAHSAPPFISQDHFNSLERS